MKKTLVISIFIFFIKIVKCSFCGSGGWVAFTDEKCFKLVDRLVNQEEAEQICNNQIKVRSSLNFLSTLASIKSPEEQQFLERYLFIESVALESVWISAKRKSDSESEFEWSDGSELEYKNWAEGNPTNNKNWTCVQIQNEFNFKNGIILKSENVTLTNNKGKWADVSCEKRNLVLCEKLQTWSFAQLQKSYIETRKNLKTLEIQSEQEITALKQNPVPIGFIYVQLPNQLDPKSIWSTVEWMDVTSAYAGLFFRAKGGDSEDFGKIQDENSPQVTEVINYIDGPAKGSPYSVKLSKGTISNGIFTGDFAGASRVFYVTLGFNVSGGEVRPRNTAIRVWRRTN